MTDLTTVEVKAFVPARDFELSKRFYRDLGFDLVWSDQSVAYFRHGASRFLLQNFYEKPHADNFMMHLMVNDVDAWWQHVQDKNLADTYGTMAKPPENHPGMRDFILTDPTGVLWRIAQQISQHSLDKS